MTEAEVFASCLALSHCHFLDTPYEGDPFSDELNSGASNVCHYCTIDTLLSIIENQCLRFTDMRFLNDSKLITEKQRKEGLTTDSIPIRPMSSLGQLFSQINLKKRKKLSPTRLSIGFETI